MPLAASNEKHQPLLIEQPTPKKESLPSKQRMRMSRVAVHPSRSMAQHHVCMHSPTEMPIHPGSKQIQCKLMQHFTCPILNTRPKPLAKQLHTCCCLIRHGQQTLRTKPDWFDASTPHTHTTAIPSEPQPSINALSPKPSINALGHADLHGQLPAVGVVQHPSLQWQ
jgi:hypothetical protein